jgi:formylglycine-generating enzyme required for sulfatase activity
MLVNAVGKRIDKGPTELVKDPRQKDGAVVNGISCMTCHVKGIIPPKEGDQIRAKVEADPRNFTKAELEQIRELYSPRAAFKEIQQADAKRFADAVAETGAHLSATDPIVALASRYEWELDINLASAEAGVRREDLIRKLDRADPAFSRELTRVLGQLKSEGGTVQRQIFADHFADLVRELQPSGKVLKPAPPVALTINTCGMKLVRIEAGKFVMGSPNKEPGRRAEESPHEVEITRPFLIGIYPVTQAEYRKVMGKLLPTVHFVGGGEYADKVRGLDTDNFPVEGISWKNAQEFCEKLSAKENRKYRLPTEAEWEYACRAGAKTAYSFGDDVKELGRYAWHAGNSGGMIHQVGDKESNAWGLFDMHGNVREYCLDRYQADYYGTRPVSDPKGPDNSHPFVVLRGGGWDGKPNEARSASRKSTAPQMSSYDNIGFRIVLEIDDKEGSKP